MRCDLKCLVHWTRLNAHRTIGIDQATLTRLTWFLHDAWRQINEKYVSAGRRSTIRQAWRTLGFMIYLAKRVDQEAAYRSFLHLRIFFLLTILLPQKNRETGWYAQYISRLLRMEDTIFVPNLLVTSKAWQSKVAYATRLRRYTRGSPRMVTNSIVH